MLCSKKILKKSCKLQAAGRLIWEGALNVKRATSKVAYKLREIKCLLIVFVWCHSSTTLWIMSAEAKKISIYSLPGPWKRELTDSTVTARQTDHRNQQKLLLPAFCFHAWKEKSTELSIILSVGCGRASGCPGQHDAPVQKLNARPAVPSSSPAVDFPPLYPTWASQPAQHAHNVKLCLISSAATNLIYTNPEHKWRNWEIARALMVTALIGVNTNCWLHFTEGTVKTKPW